MESIVWARGTLSGTWRPKGSHIRRSSTAQVLCQHNKTVHPSSSPPAGPAAGGAGGRPKPCTRTVPSSPPRARGAAASPGSCSQAREDSTHYVFVSSRAACRSNNVLGTSLGIATAADHTCASLHASRSGTAPPHSSSRGCLQAGGGQAGRRESTLASWLGKPRASLLLSTAPQPDQAAHEQLQYR